MKRRSFLSAIAALLPASVVAGESSHPGGALDQWISQSQETIPTKPAQWPTANKVLQWAAMCLRRGLHWTFEGIDWATAHLPFMRNHLIRVHGHTHDEVAGKDRNYLIALHDAAHEGTSFGNFVFPATPQNGMNHMPQYIMDTLPQSNCPGGHCPIPQRHRRG